MKMKNIILLLSFLSVITNAQVLNNKEVFTRQDSLRGTNNEYRNWWDVIHYSISVEPIEEERFISGNVIIRFNEIKKKHNKLLQIDLQEPMQIDSLVLNGKTISDFKREGNAFFVNTDEVEIKPKNNNLQISYSGNPKIAVKAPWDGGWIFTKDQEGNPWMSVAVQGLGASAWYPNKDYQGDKSDKGSDLEIILPKGLVGIGNGRLVSANEKNKKVAYKWRVVNPINNYNIIPYIGHYANFKEIYKGKNGPLDLNYFVLEHHIDKAKSQFKQVKLMLKSFEDWFGPYPFYEDSYKIIEAPYLGMEHQSGIAYGNGFANGYLGRDLSGSDWGLKWDFIIIHESGHEWFGNSITSEEIADMWIHEAFTSYSETLFTETYYGKKAADEYVRGTRKAIKNDVPIIGIYGINREGSEDMYYKGSNMLHTLRTWMNDDERFKEMLRGLSSEFYHKAVTTAQIENYMSKFTRLDLSKFFDQYLRTTKIPTLQARRNGNHIEFRYINVVKGFTMPLRLKDSKETIYPTTDWQRLNNNSIKTVKDFIVDPNYLIETDIKL